LRRPLEITPGLVRMSIGLEQEDDLSADPDKALRKC
jgi:cystathionine beta-lyase/cystathionine gamma-synthase